MSNNIYDTANQLERDLRESELFASLKDAFEGIQNNEEASELFEEFKEASQKYQMYQMMGQQPSEEEQKELQELSERVTENEHIKALMDAEQQLNQLIQDINNIITKPLLEVYQPEQEEE
ncbi:YlbF family regulator [Dolosicoccus paucivorans]|uniref:YlbF family regulator n=1 Tax=Dolosicoccus paucivorans TaxID=84521 RepID=UPI00088EEB22|nr:YlbF family regulator [Dolosicoccus paucivorans]SDI75126.1 Cell fate regulator YlbF, YheA/YmcA/DUF963 family (controls sporulation, competence, biofilm development) [Dolosicoccus paucivorans]